MESLCTAETTMFVGARGLENRRALTGAPHSDTVYGVVCQAGLWLQREVGSHKPLEKRAAQASMGWGCMGGVLWKIETWSALT